MTYHYTTWDRLMFWADRTCQRWLRFQQRRIGDPLWRDAHHRSIAAMGREHR
jgi:hypothetical protein